MRPTLEAPESSSMPWLAGLIEGVVSSWYMLGAILMLVLANGGCYGAGFTMHC